MCFISPKSADVLLTIDFDAFYAFRVHFIFLLLVFHKLWAPNKHFTLKRDSDVCDSFIGSG
jgi:hypothetical protein